MVRSSIRRVRRPCEDGRAKKYARLAGRPHPPHPAAWPCGGSRALGHAPNRSSRRGSDCAPFIDEDRHAIFPGGPARRLGKSAGPFGRPSRRRACAREHARCRAGVGAPGGDLRARFAACVMDARAGRGIGRRAHRRGLRLPTTATASEVTAFLAALDTAPVTPRPGVALGGPEVGAQGEVIVHVTPGVYVLACVRRGDGGHRHASAAESAVLHVRSARPAASAFAPSRTTWATLRRRQGD